MTDTDSQGETPAGTSHSPALLAPRAAPGDDPNPGERIRQIRKARRLSLTQVSQRADLSASFLSQLERGKTNGTIASLRRLAHALSVPLADLFDSAAVSWPQVLRKADRPTLDTGEGVEKFLISRPPLRSVEVYVAVLDPGAATGTEPYAHGDSQEIVVVMTGRLSIRIGEDEFVLEAGDSIEYESSRPHHAFNSGAVAAEVMWITSPPTDAAH